MGGAPEGKPGPARAKDGCAMAGRSRRGAGQPGVPAGDGGGHVVRFLTVAEVATAMRVSRMTVYRLVHAGTLPAVQVGRSFRIPEQAVHDYLRESYIQAG